MLRNVLSCGGGGGGGVMWWWWWSGGGGGGGGACLHVLSSCLFKASRLENVF